jgi:hypothetical protein
LAARIREAHFELKPRWRLATLGTLLLEERRGRVLAVEGLSLESLIADQCRLEYWAAVQVEINGASDDLSSVGRTFGPA